MFRSILSLLSRSSKAAVAAPKKANGFKPTLSTLEDRENPAPLAPVMGTAFNLPLGGDTYVNVGSLGIDYVKDCADFGLDKQGIDVRVGMGGPQGPSVILVYEGPDGNVAQGVELAGGAWAAVASMIGFTNEPEAAQLYQPNDKGLMPVAPYIVFGAPGAGNLPPGF